MDVHQMWEALNHKKLGVVARENGMSQQALVALFDTTGLTGRMSADPSPSEIADRAAAIRSRWSPQTEASRWIAARKVSHC